MGSQRAGIKVIGSDNDSEGIELIIRLVLIGTRPFPESISEVSESANA